MSYHYVIFDLDGTLLSTLSDIRASLNHTLALYGLRLQTGVRLRLWGAERLQASATRGLHGHRTCF